MSRPKRVGFVINNHVPNMDAVMHFKCYPWSPLTGWNSKSSIGIMRYEWIARVVNREHRDIRYEVYKPWHNYDAVIFLKSMGSAAYAEAEKSKKRGAKIIFDLNVDYLTPAAGEFHYNGMRPTDEQRIEVLKMIEISHAVIADSTYLEKVCMTYHPHVRWISDNVDCSLVPARKKCRREGKLTLLWSGEAIKLFELLKIEDVIRSFSKQVRLVMITNDRSAMNRWHGDYAARFTQLLTEVEHAFIPFRSVEQLFELYSLGGVIISPRFLDNSYNFGHTEWKITLGMACGRFALCSPVPSYCDVSARSGGRGIRICNTDAEWSIALDEILAGADSLLDEEEAAREVVRQHYSSEVVSRLHRKFTMECLTVSESGRD